MAKYKIGASAQVVPTIDERGYGNGVRTIRDTGGTYFLQCCGLAGLQGFTSVPAFKDWNDKAEYISAIYRHLYDRGNVVYTLTNYQLENTLHQAFLELGAEEIAVFPNLYHDPSTIHMFKVNIRRACGRFCNKYGEAYAEPPKDASEVHPREDVCHTPYGTLPVR